MLSTENLVVPGSDYYIYTPSAQAQSLFLYPLIVGRFQYLPGYCLRRTSLDSFLIMHITGAAARWNGADSASLPGRSRW